MSRIALFGGSFNPPHVAHQLAALYVLETQPVDELWFLPTFAHPFHKVLADYEHRVAMCELAAARVGAKVSRAEEALAHEPGFVASRTLDLLEHLARQGYDQLRWVIGADILGEASKWYRWDEVVKRAPLIVVGRTGYSLPPGSEATGVTLPEISSTHARELAGNGDYGALAPLVPHGVLRYIRDHHLYR